MPLESERGEPERVPKSDRSDSPDFLEALLSISARIAAPVQRHRRGVPFP